MTVASPCAASPHYNAAESLDVRGYQVAARFGDPAAEQRASREAAALFDRNDRGLLILTGKDRRSWLHNLVTNAIKTLDDGQGNYAFAVDVRGRIQFDLNVLARPDALWVDVDAGTAARAAAHFDRFLITEDVKIENATERLARIAVCGAAAGDAAAKIGCGNFAALPALATVTLTPEALLLRHDFAGAPGFELFIPRAAAAAWWSRLVAEAGCSPAGYEVLDIARIEAGIPWLYRDMDEKTLPPETGQVERGISYHKGCYLGQEVIERMRSHASLARRLVRVKLGDGAGVVPPAPLQREGAEVGRLTSLARRPTDGGWIGLAYVKTSVKEFAGITVGDPSRTVGVVNSE